MKLSSFTAETAAEAVAKIRSKLGPDAVVVNVRKVSGDGISRLWKKPHIEVLAYKPEAKEPEVALTGQGTPNTELLKTLMREVESIKTRMHQAPAEAAAERQERPARQPLAASDHASIEDEWRVTDLLQASGLLPVNALRVMEVLQMKQGLRPPQEFADEAALARATLTNLWRPLRRPLDQPGVVHIFVGPSGSGKTTVLSKWLTHVAMMEGRPAHVWRLDSNRANTAESLSIYCEILGVGLDRTWPGADDSLRDMGFVDLPGVDWWDEAAVEELGRQLQTFGPSQVHLVLNVAYEMPLLEAQVRAFRKLPIADMIVTHLDEEVRWGKIWNLVLGTNHPVSFFSSGQNIPGGFEAAGPEKLLARQFSGS